uniref:C4-type zinc finger protein, DksA/TraR family n=4 Tax=Gammaproteobacteria TaxID=1236 RepID=A0A6B7Q1Y2_9PSED|nr:C4-type zinc finger protein, DksA/TraR family [Pseudomonas monteilii]
MVPSTCRIDRRDAGARHIDPTNHEAQSMTPQELLQQPDDQYMNPEQVAFFKNLLVSESATATGRIEQLRIDLTGLEKAPDEVDAALIEQERQSILGSIERENQSLRDIKQAMSAIADGSYGWCEDTGEPIGLRRLLSSPRSLLTVEAKESRENKSRHLRAA